MLVGVIIVIFLRCVPVLLLLLFSVQMLKLSELVCAWCFLLSVGWCRPRLFAVSPGGVASIALGATLFQSSLLIGPWSGRRSTWSHSFRDPLELTETRCLGSP